MAANATHGGTMNGWQLNGNTCNELPHMLQSSGVQTVIYTIQKAAEYLGKSERMIRYYVTKSYLTPAEYVGRQPIFDEADLARLKQAPPPGRGWPRGKPRKPPKDAA